MIYILVLEVKARVSVGRLGPLDFDGCYLYVGSALGGGDGGTTARLDRVRARLVPG